jgi:hypothetical protein
MDAERIVELREFIVDYKNGTDCEHEEIDWLVENMSECLDEIESLRKERKFEIISYDGKYPNLCSGCLKVMLDGAEYALHYPCCSGGGLDKNYCAYSGRWYISKDLDKQFVPYANEIVNWMNDNVSFGCCGGCA